MIDVKYIIRAKALRISHEIIERAECERIQIADDEAKRETPMEINLTIFSEEEKNQALFEALEDKDKTEELRQAILQMFTAEEMSYTLIGTLLEIKKLHEEKEKSE